MKFPVIKVIDKDSNRSHIVGTNHHDQLVINENGSISYLNLQILEGTGPRGAYNFQSNSSFEKQMIVEFVSFEELQELYQEDKVKKDYAEKNLHKFLQNYANDLSRGNINE